MFMKDFTRTMHAVLATQPARDPVATGLLAGTLVETATGWRAVETLRMGDRVHTFDGGLAQLLAVDRHILPPEAAQAVITIPGGSLDACTDAHVLPGQHLAIDTLQDPDLPDSAYALIPAMALKGRLGCTLTALRRPIAVITPIFASEELVWAQSGLLLHCPGIADAPGSRPDSGFFACLSAPAAQRLLARRHDLLAA